MSPVDVQPMACLNTAARNVSDIAAEDKPRSQATQALGQHTSPPRP